MFTSFRRSISPLLACAFLASLVTRAPAAVAQSASRADIQRITPVQLPPASAHFNSATGQWEVSGELFNPTSGFYTGVAQKSIGPHNPPCTGCAPDLDFVPIQSDSAPLPGTPANVYGRVSWHSLEPAEGHYDFAVLDHVLTPCTTLSSKTACLPKGATFGFRVMAFNPQYKLDTNVTSGADGYPVYSDAPAYLQKDAAGRAHGWLLSDAPWPPSARFVSSVDLRKVLPACNEAHQDVFMLPTDWPPGSYELDVRVVDPRHYLAPMQLALASTPSDGYYMLGTIQIPRGSLHPGR